MIGEAREPTEAIKIETNKATIRFVDAHRVVKTFRKRERIVLEWKNLRHLWSVFRTNTSDGWTYRVVEPFSYDRSTGSLVMERLYGVQGGVLFKTNPQLVCRKMGRWLAVFHNTTEDGTGNVLQYWDLNRTNVMINQLTREVIVFDPAPRFGRCGVAEVDLIVTSYSIIVGALQIRRSPAALVRSFLEAYREVRPLVFSNRRFEVGYGDCRDYLFSKYRNRRFPANTVALLGPILSRLYIKPVLKRTMRIRGGR